MGSDSSTTQHREAGDGGSRRCNNSTGQQIDEASVDAELTERQHQGQGGEREPHRLFQGPIPVARYPRESAAQAGGSGDADGVAADDQQAGDSQVGKPVEQVGRDGSQALRAAHTDGEQNAGRDNHPEEKHAQGSGDLPYRGSPMGMVEPSSEAEGQ